MPRQKGQVIRSPTTQAQTVTTATLFQATRHRLALNLSEGRTESGGDLVFRDHAAELLRGEGEGDEVLRFDPLGQ